MTVMPPPALARPTSLAFLLLGAGMGCNPPEDRNIGGSMGTDLVESGVLLCADPSARNSEGPFMLQEAGGDWVDVPYTADDGGLSLEWGLAVADFDGDEHLDVFLPRFQQGLIYLGDGAGNFTLGDTERVPVPAYFYDIYAMGASVVDVDADGDLDIAQSSFGGLVIFLNDGNGYFEEGQVDLGLDGVNGMSFSTSWADFDGDGDLDGYMPMYVTEDPAPEDINTGEFVDGVPGILMENRGSEGFVDRSELLPTETNDGHPFVGGWHDLDGDLRPEILLAHDHGREIRSNRAWHFDGDAFIDITDESGMDAALDSMGLGIGDINGDQIPDFVFTGWGEFVLLESTGSGTWYQAQFARGLVPALPSHQVGWGVEMGDMDNDGDLDVMSMFGNWENYPETMEDYEEVNPTEQPDALYLMGSDGMYTESAAEWGIDDSGIGRGMVLADMNEDGWLDLVKRRIFDQPQIHLSRCGEEAWMHLKLSGPEANPYGIGARVTIQAGDERWVRWMSAGGTSIASGSPPELHFGLGDVDRIDSLLVDWPDGQKSEFGAMDSRQRLRILHRRYAPGSATRHSRGATQKPAQSGWAFRGGNNTRRQRY